MRATRAAPRWSGAVRRDVVLVANGSASGLHGSRELDDYVERRLRRRGAGVETHVTASLEEVAATSVAFHERLVVLLRVAAQDRGARLLEDGLSRRWCPELLDHSDDRTLRPRVRGRRA